jgi:hypothetical protein
MLDFYLSSIIIWFIILFSEVVVFNKQIRNNGWLDMQKKRNIIRTLVSYVLFAALPIFRLLTAIALFMMACVSKERFEKFAEEYKTKDDTNERPRED